MPRQIATGLRNPYLGKGLIKETLRRTSNRHKRVPDNLVREHHQATLGWPGRYRVDTTALSVGHALGLIVAAPNHSAPSTWS